MISYQKTTFIKSVAALPDLPADTGYEVAFVGYSNVGKSSVLNIVCQQKGLARTSKTPGRTQLINIFGVDAKRRLIDLPGYGYAKVSRQLKNQWQALLTEYLQSRQCLRGLVVVMDIRHPLKPIDEWLIEWSTETQLPLHLLLNKSDKLSSSAAKTVLLTINKDITPYPHVSAQLFSTTKKTGREELYHTLDEWFHIPD